MSLYSNTSADKQNTSDLVKRDVLDLLFGQHASVLFAHVVTTFIYAFWISDVVQSTSLLNWVVLSLLIVFARFALSLIYQRYGRTELSPKRWLAMWTGLTVSLSLSYVYATIVLTPFDEPQYFIAVSTLLMAICGASSVSYAASMYAIACMVVPMSVITPGFLLYHGIQHSSHEALVAAVAIICFMLIILALIRRVNIAFIKSIELNYQNKQEIEKRKVIERQLYDMSRRDSLTGLFNRRYFDEMLEVELGRAYRSHSALSLVLLDIDHFKEYNDHYGHVAGDNCLIDIAHIIERQTNRKGDLVSRYGGEEFAIILPGIDAKGARAFANRLREFIEKQRIEHKATQLTSLGAVTISLGVTTVVPLMKVKPSQLIDQADKALYDAKREGRNRVKAFAPFGIDHGMT